MKQFALPKKKENKGKAPEKKSQGNKTRTPLKKASVDHIMHLQQTIGNQAVQRMIIEGTLQLKDDHMHKSGDYDIEIDALAQRVLTSNVEIPPHTHTQIVAQCKWEKGEMEKVSTLDPSKRAIYIYEKHMNLDDIFTYYRKYGTQAKKELYDLLVGVLDESEFEEMVLRFESITGLQITTDKEDVKLSGVTEDFVKNKIMAFTEEKETELTVETKQKLLNWMSSSPTAKKLFQKANKAGVKVNFGKGKFQAYTGQVKETTTVVLPDFSDEIDAIATFLFELNNSVRQNLFKWVDQQVKEGKINDENTYWETKNCVEARGMKTVAKIWDEMTKGFSDIRDKYAEKFWLVLKDVKEEVIAKLLVEQKHGENLYKKQFQLLKKL
jgi:hypothetical protein